MGIVISLTMRRPTHRLCGSPAPWQEGDLDFIEGLYPDRSENPSVVFFNQRLDRPHYAMIVVRKGPHPMGRYADPRDFVARPDSEGRHRKGMATKGKKGAR